MNCLYCDNPLTVQPKTKPSKYCSPKCKAAWHRLREKVFAECGVNSLVLAVTQVFNSADLDDDEVQLAAMIALANHKLIRRPWPISLMEVPVSPDLADRLLSSPAGSEPAPTSSLAAGQSISADIDRQVREREREALTIIDRVAAETGGHA